MLVLSITSTINKDEASNLEVASFCFSPFTFNYLFYVCIHFYVNALFKNVKICYYGYNDNLLLKMTYITNQWFIKF